jgi:hypothetical protein
MWFAKWFGRRETEEDEPARFTAPAQPERPRTPPKTIKPSSPGKGFDPYNSGAFESRSAWERINRR